MARPVLRSRHICLNSRSYDFGGGSGDDDRCAGAAKPIRTGFVLIVVRRSKLGTRPRSERQAYVNDAIARQSSSGSTPCFFKMIQDESLQSRFVPVSSSLRTAIPASGMCAVRAA
jgi:hypothetical protein